MPRYRDAVYGGETVVLENPHLRLEIHKRVTSWGWGELFVRGPDGVPDVAQHRWFRVRARDHDSPQATRGGDRLSDRCQCEVVTARFPTRGGLGGVAEQPRCWYVQRSRDLVDGRHPGGEPIVLLQFSDDVDTDARGFGEGLLREGVAMPVACDHVADCRLGHIDQGTRGLPSPASAASELSAGQPVSSQPTAGR